MVDPVRKDFMRGSQLGEVGWWIAFALFTTPLAFPQEVKVEPVPPRMAILVIIMEEPCPSPQVSAANLRGRTVRESLFFLCPLL